MFFKVLFKCQISSTDLIKTQKFLLAFRDYFQFELISSTRKPIMQILNGKYVQLLRVIKAI